MIVLDGHGGRIGITTHRNVPKCLKKRNFKKIGEKVFGQGVGGQGRSCHEKHRGFFYLFYFKSRKSLIFLEKYN